MRRPPAAKSLRWNAAPAAARGGPPACGGADRGASGALWRSRRDATECGLPRAYYAHGDMQTGEKLLLLENLEECYPAGLCFGKGNPNNALSSHKSRAVKRHGHAMSI